MNEPTSELNLAYMARPAPREGAPDAGVPGLLLLHGRGADEADLMGLEAALDPRLAIVSARAPFRLGMGYAWYGMPAIGKPDVDTIRASVSQLEEFIEGMLPAFGIDPRRLFLMGFSQGAVMSAAMALTNPGSVRGVLMHSGYIPIGAGLDTQPDALSEKPFFVAHGQYDEIIPVSFGRQAQRLLTDAGALFTYKEYPIGHSISEESLYDLSEWLTREVEASV